MTLLISLIIIVLWGTGYFLGESVIASGLIIGAEAGMIAALTAIISLIAFVWIGQKQIYSLALSSYLLIAATALAVITTTGNTASPYIALWMLVSVFAGLFGIYGLAPLTLGALSYMAYLVVGLSVGRDQLTVFVLAFLLPLAISYLIWHKKSTHENDKDRAYSALAQQLSQVANKSEIVINAIADGVVAIDGRGTIQLINPAAQQIMGWGKQDAIGLDYRSVMKFTDGKDEVLTEDADLIQQVLKINKTVSSNDLKLTTNGDKKLLISLLVSPVGSYGTGAIIVFRDITDSAAEEKQQAEFISTASHEMRTPVAAIEGYLGLALNPTTATIDDKARSYLMKAHESAQHLGRLFQDLLDIAKAEDGRLQNNAIVIDVTAFTRDITASLLPNAQQKGLFLLYKPDVPETVAQRVTPVFYSLLDSDHLREILGNLIDNAIKYTKQGNITVDINGDVNHIVVSVSDTGIGIPAEDIPHLFQKFYRVDTTDTREIGGTGLGLYLCRRLTESMGGRLWVESEYGKGSVFNVEFSRLSHEAAMQRIEMQSASSEQSPQSAIQT